MTFKLSDLFIPLSGKCTYSVVELSALKLKADFIKKIAAHFDLIFVENKDIEGNLCFAENKDVRIEYRKTFNKMDVVEHIFSQLPGETVNIERDKIAFQKGFFF